MSAEVVGPVPSVYFGGGPRGGSRIAVPYSPPTNTLDPRYRACTDHHVACDCREAEFAENLAELRSEYHAVIAAFEEVLAGHNVGDEYDQEGRCSCTGCQIARRAHIWVESAWKKPGVDF